MRDQQVAWMNIRRMRFFFIDLHILSTCLYSSGFLYFLTRLDNEKWGYLETMKEKLERFGIPFVVFTLVGMIIKSAFAGSVDRPTTISFGEFFHALIYPGKGPMGEFWFIGAIMWFFALFPLWKILIRNTRLSIVALLVLAAISIWHPGSEFLASSHVSKYAIYFYIGIICATLYKKNPEIITARKFTLSTFMVGILIYLTGRSLRLPLMAPLGGVMFSLSISCWLDKRLPKIFSSFRNYTYQIYIMGIFFNVLMIMLRRRLGLPFAPCYLVSFLLGLYMPVLISKLLEWINWKPLLLCVGLKKK